MVICEFTAKTLNNLANRVTQFFPSTEVTQKKKKNHTQTNKDTINIYQVFPHKKKITFQQNSLELKHVLTSSSLVRSANSWNRWQAWFDVIAASAASATQADGVQCAAAWPTFMARTVAHVIACESSIGVGVSLANTLYTNCWLNDVDCIEIDKQEREHYIIEILHKYTILLW